MPVYRTIWTGAGTKRDPFRPLGVDGMVGWNAVDLRPDGTKVSGECLLWTPEPVTSTVTQFALMGEDKDERPAMSVMRAHASLGIAPQTLGDLIGAVVNRQIKLTPELSEPGVSDHRRFAVYLGGERWWSQDVPPKIVAVTATDNFNRTAENPLSDGGNWTIHPTSPATLETNGTQLTCAASDDERYYYRGITPGNDQYAEIESGTPVGDQDYGPCVRMHTTAKSFYGYDVVVSAGPQLFIYDAGSYSNIASAPATITSGDIVRVTINGSTLTGLENGVSRGSTTNTTLTSGRVGILVYAGSTVLDNWGGGDLTVAAGIFPPFGRRSRTATRKAA